MQCDEQCRINEAEYRVYRKIGKAWWHPWRTVYELSKADAEAAAAFGQGSEGTQVVVVLCRRGTARRKVQLIEALPGTIIKHLQGSDK